MTNFKRSVLVLLVAVLPACGQQVVEFDGGGGGAGGGTGTGGGSGGGGGGSTDSGLPDSGITDGGSTDAGGDVIAPTVISTRPADGATDVTTATTVGATFSEPMNASSITVNSFTVTQGANAVPGLVGATGAIATFSPLSPLSPGLLYTATLTTAATDRAGNPLAMNFSWTFTTTLLADTTPPTVVLVNPLDMAVNVPITRRLSATFSEPMNAATLNTNTFTLAQGLNAIAGTVSFDALTATATFVPTQALMVNTVYTATLTTGVQDRAANAMVNPFVWSFTTAACGQGPIDLRSAANFVVLGGSTVTSIGPSSVGGDLGVSPGNAITGFPPGTVTGAQYPGGPIAAQAIADLNTAFDEAEGRTVCAVTIAGNVGGQTLTPGLYKSTSSFAISSGDLTLDAQGDPDAVFIFQAASTLTTTAGRQVILAGGAKSANVFWQVGTSATLGTGSVFQGTIMADQAVTLNTGATLNGRALAIIAAVTLDANIIIKPAP